VAGPGGEGSPGPLNGHHDVSPVNDSHCEMDSSLLSHSTTSRNLKQLIFCHSSEILRKAITKPYENTEPHTTYLHHIPTPPTPPTHTNISSFRSLRTALQAPRARAFAPYQLAANYHSSSLLRMPYKDDQDRNSLKPKSTEGSKSGTDQGTAETDAAFDPSKTRPEEEKEAAGSEKEGNPLAVRGANQKKSVPLGDKGGPEMKGTTKNRGWEG
jgi:hypothetical protein